MAAPSTRGRSSNTKSARPVPTFDHLSKKKAVTERVPICLDPELSKRLMICEARVDDEQGNLALARGDTDTAKARRALEDARAALEAARAAVDESLIEVVFQSIGRPAWEALLDRHPPTDKQVEEASKEGHPRPQYDERSLQMEAISLSAIEPVMTVDQVKSLFESETWNTAELLALWAGCLSANQQHRVVDLGKD